MKIHPADLPLQAPNTCALCEHSPNPGDVVIDVERNFNTPDLEYGRKYVCQGCAEDIARLRGFGSPQEVHALESRVSNAEEAARVAASVDELKGSVDEFIESVKGFHVNVNPSAEPDSPQVEARKEVAAKATPKKRSKKVNSGESASGADSARKGNDDSEHDAGEVSTGTSGAQPNVTKPADLKRPDAGVFEKDAGNEDSIPDASK